MISGEVVLATGNAGKRRELEALLAPRGYVLRGMNEFGLEGAEENGLSFVENALIKARAVAQSTERPALADDSGLVVPALAGEPGIHSARYGGAHGDSTANNRLLIERMQKLTDHGRDAYFYCALVLLRHATDPTPIIATGQWNGRILEQARGHGGFGYDPLFLPEGSELAAAELDARVKNRISHRGQALKALLKQLE